MRKTPIHLVMFAFLSFGLNQAFASPPPTETKSEIVHQTTTNVEISLTEETVICSSADYGALFLKILIPELAGLTLLDHQNLGAGAPCVAAGMCFGENVPDSILNDSPTEEVEIAVTATRNNFINHKEQTCTVSLTEDVNILIRGVEFTHTRYASLGSRIYQDCL